MDRRNPRIWRLAHPDCCAGNRLSYDQKQAPFLKQFLPAQSKILNYSGQILKPDEHQFFKQIFPTILGVIGYTYTLMLPL